MSALPNQETPLEVIEEQHESHLQFNVMPDRPVEETLKVNRYLVGERYAEAHFDREYKSSMAASPSHLIFLSTLVHTQKLLYLALCQEFGFEYDPNGEEKFKMWPTKIDVKIPELIAEEEGLVQKLWIKEVKKFNDTTYRVALQTRVGSMSMDIVVPVFMR